MDKNEYLRFLRKRRVRRIFAGGVLPLILLSLGWLAIQEVRTGFIMPLTPRVSSYLLYTLPQRFSNKDLLLILQQETGSTDLYRKLVLLYWSYIASTTVAFALPLLFGSKISAEPGTSKACCEQQVCGLQ